MLQQGAMAFTSFHGKLSQPLKHARGPALHSLLASQFWMGFLIVLDVCEQGTVAFTMTARFPHASMFQWTDLLLTKYSMAGVQLIRVLKTHTCLIQVCQ